MSSGNYVQSYLDNPGGSLLRVLIAFADMFRTPPRAELEPSMLVVGQGADRDRRGSD